MVSGTNTDLRFNLKMEMFSSFYSKLVQKSMVLSSKWNIVDRL